MSKTTISSFQNWYSNDADKVEYQCNLAKNVHNTNQVTLNALKKVIPVIIANELSPKQQRYIKMYFYERKSISEIAEELAINKSTVSRVLDTSIKTIKNYLRYCRDILAIVPIDID